MSRTPIAATNDLACVKVLLEKDPESWKWRGDGGTTPLGWAIAGKEKAVIDYLVTVDPDEEGVALVCAAANDDLENLKYFISRCETKPGVWDYALERAAYVERKNAVAYLLTEDKFPFSIAQLNVIGRKFRGEFSAAVQERIQRQLTVAVKGIIEEPSTDLIEKSRDIQTLFNSSYTKNASAEAHESWMALLVKLDINQQGFALWWACRSGTRDSVIRVMKRYSKKPPLWDQGSQSIWILKSG